MPTNDRIAGHLETFHDKAGKAYWRIRLDYGRSETSGEREQPRDKEWYYVRKDGLRALARRLHDLNSVPATSPKRRTVDELVTEWLEVEAAVSLRPGNLPNYESVCRLHIRPFLGAAVAARLTTGEIEKWRTGRLAAGLSRDMAGKASLHLGQAFDYGIRHGYLSHNPVRSLRRLKQEHKEMQVWDATQARAFKAVAANHAYEPFWTLALDTGARCGELLALEWGDVDWDHRVLAIRRSLDKDPAIGLQSTKSGVARVVALAPETLALLRRHQTAQKKRRLQLGKLYGNSRLIIATQDGHYLGASNVNRALKGSRRGKETIHGGLAQAAGVPYIRVHGLRHTSASLLLAAGVPVKVVSERLGHASVMVTLNIYAHVLPGMSQSAADQLASILYGRADSPQIAPESAPSST